MNREEADGFDNLVAALLDGTLERDGMLRLLEMCRADAALKDRFERHVEVHRLMEMALEGPSRVLFTAEIMERINQRDPDHFTGPVIRKVTEISRRRRWMRWSASAAAAASLVMGTTWWFSAQEAHATLHRGDTARWIGKEPPSDLRAGSLLKLDSGLAEIHFKNGAELILEGPAEFEIRSGSKGRLERGKIMARVPERGVGFTLESPSGKVIDLGTSFGMNVSADGETETQVFEGKVEVRPAGESGGMILHENEKFAVGGKGGGKSTGVADSGFVTSLPPRSGEDIPFIHWPMDEAGGFRVGARLPGGVVDPVPADLRTFREEVGFPAWIGGPFGSALSFNGDGHAVETYHQGPRHGAARTIAFWVRVPVDFDPAQGLGIISWGKLREWGTAWQISVNPYGKEGSIGRLRVGTGKSGVVGVTDLRDGKWHHCAVVLYQDPARSDRFPVLLYVDGRMESASSKAVYGVNTHGGEDARPIWIGRSLGHGREDKPHEGSGFFRGDLDEVYVFEGALNPRQIGNLMSGNQAPGQ